LSLFAKKNIRKRMKKIKQLILSVLLTSVFLFAGCQKDLTQTPNENNSVAGVAKAASGRDTIPLHLAMNKLQRSSTPVPTFTMQSEGGTSYLLTASIYSTNPYSEWDFVLYKNGSHYNGAGYQDSNFIQASTWSTTVSLGPGAYYFNVYNPLYSYDTPSITLPQPPPNTYDQFPSRYNTTLFNYNTGLNPNINGTIINVSDTNPVLVVGQSIYSPNQMVRLTLQTDGNLVLYRKNSDGTQTATWSSWTTGGEASQSLYFQTDGNLVIYPGTNTPTNHVPNSGLWGSNINASGLGTVTYAFYRLQDDGDLVFYWPNYYGYTGFVNIIAGASDSQSGRSAHIGSLVRPLWSPAMQQAIGSSYTPKAP